MEYKGRAVVVVVVVVVVGLDGVGLLVGRFGLGL